MPPARAMRRSRTAFFTEVTKLIAHLPLFLGVRRSL
jgi:hypothetical protein